MPSLKKKLSWMMLAILIFSFLTMQEVNIGGAQAPSPTPEVFVDPSVINDETLSPSVLSRNSYPSTHAYNATVTNPTYAYDKDQTTAASISPGSTTPSYFEVATFNSTFVQPYVALEVKLNYSVTLSNSQYRILACVGSANTTLQTWTSLSQATPSVKTWTGIPEPNDGDWNQTDLTNLRIRVETKKTIPIGSGTFKMYEVWVSILGDSFKVKINITNVEDLYGWQINMTFNPAVLNTATASIIEGPFLQKAGTTLPLKSVDNSAGVLTLGSSLQPPYPPNGASGNGTLVYVTFKVKAAERGTLLQFVQPTKLNKVVADNLVPIAHTTKDGIFDNRAGNTPPVANFSILPLHANQRGVVKFDASASSDDGWLVSYYWDYGDGQNETYIRELLRNINLTTIATHTYTESGTYTVTLTVTDNNSTTAAVSIPVIISYDIAVINVKPSHIAAMAGVPVTINVTTMNNGNYTETFPVKTYYNETVIATQDAVQLAPQAQETLTFNWNTTGLSLGNYIIKANASAITGETNTTNNQHIDGFVTIAESNIIDYPVIIGGFTFYVSVNSTSLLEDFNFNATEKEISFQTTKGWFLNITVPIDLLGGNYTTLIDNLPVIPDGETTNGTHVSLYFTYSQDTHTVEITGETVATPPVAVFTASTTRPLVDTSVTFNASDSYDPDGNYPLAYFWDFGNGNTTDTGTIVEHVYTEIGTYNVTLTVKDTKQLANSAKATITVIDYPQADFTYSPDAPLVNQTITFNATASKPNGGSITNYAWDFGDGLTGAGVITTHSYLLSGNHTVTLTITDSEELTNATQRLVTVKLHNIAITNLTVSPNTVEIGESVTIQVTVANKGNFTESFTVTAYYNNEALEIKSISNLAPEDSQTLTTVWNTADVPLDVYTIRAEASTVTGETKTDDNNRIDGTVTVQKISSTLSINASSTTLNVGATTIISGSLDPIRQDVSVKIQYRLVGGGTWSTLKTVATDTQGRYTHDWTPEASGTYEVKASWQGDAITQLSESIVLTITVQEEQTLINFLYIAGAAAVIIVLITAAIYFFLRIRKPKAP